MNVKRDVTEWKLSSQCEGAGTRLLHTVTRDNGRIMYYSLLHHRPITIKTRDLRIPPE